MESHRVCSERVRSYTRTKHESLLVLSQEAGKIFLEEQAHTNLKFETDGRVDVVAETSTGQILRIELKLISQIIEAKARVTRAIRTTKNQLKAKRLTHLLILTLVRKVETDDERVIKVKEYCLLGIFVSRSELEKKDEKELIREIGEEVRGHLEEGYELISISREEFLRNWEQEETRQEQIEQLQKSVQKLSEEVKLQGEAIQNLDQKLDEKLSETQKQLTDILNLLKKKLND